MTDFPDWLATEAAVQHFFILLGFDVKNVSIAGRQIDVIASRNDMFTGNLDTWIIEVTQEYVGVDKGSRDSQKLLLAKSKYKNANLMIVSTSGFTDDQKATLGDLGIFPKMYHELESTLLPLRRYAIAAKMELTQDHRFDIGYHPEFYIEPELEVRLNDNSPTKIVGKDWINSVLDSPKAGVCAVLGGLGSGKTSLLKRLLEKGIESFLKDPDIRPLPIYIPLGRYKQHAGDLDQMMMSELRRAGIQNYPAALVRFLLSKRRLILLLDGLDEVHPIQNTNDVLDTVTNIVSGIGQEACGIISCRRQFFESSTEEQAYFGSYTAGKLRDLNLSLRKRLRGDSSSYIASIKPFDESRITEYLNRRCGFSATETKDLIARYYGFTELATTPVLLAMIATTASDGSLEVRNASPFPLVQLYEAYTKRWIERDADRARLSSNQRERFSEHLADRMLWQGLDSASWGELADALREDEKWRDNPLTQEEAELDIRNSGFLVRELDDRWRFAHRSILEYFAARAENKRLGSGERPRPIPTDGYRLFLTVLLARSWFDKGEPPLPTYAWNATSTAG